MIPQGLENPGKEGPVQENIMHYSSVARRKRAVFLCLAPKRSAFFRKSLLYICNIDTIIEDSSTSVAAVEIPHENFWIEGKQRTSLECSRIFWRQYNPGAAALPATREAEREATAAGGEKVNVKLGGRLQ